MDFVWWNQWIALAMGVWGIWAAGRHPYGWIIAALASVPWTVYSLPRNEWAFVAATWLYALIEFRNWYIGRSNKKS